jgi:CubicO group peptidase (beta-lactamase class C family)
MGIWRQSSVLQVTRLYRGVSRVVGVPLCLAVTLAPVGGSAADRFEPVREYIRSEMVQQSVPSVAVAVAREGHIVWEEGFGWADRERRIAATEHTMYSLASISKPFTATGLMTLVQSGKIDLDKPVNDYLGEAKLHARVGDARDATVRRVANHTSGLPLHYQFFYADEPVAVPSTDETILRYGNLVTMPGERFQYSNLGFGILGYVIARVSGVSYAEFMRREVFLPLGLTHTSVNIGPGLEGYAATRYGPDGLPIPFYDFDHPGASAIFASAHDLVRFGMFHLKEHLRDQKAILSDASIDEMHRSTAQEGSGPVGAYGIGFDLDDQDGYPYFGHDGGMAGVATRMRLFREQRLAVVVLTNSASGLSKQVMHRIVAVVLPELRHPEEHAPPPASAPSFTVPAQLMGMWKGALQTYVNTQPVELRFLPNGDVHVRFGNQLETLVNESQFKAGVFRGQFASHLGTPDADRYEHDIRLSLTLRGEVLNGAATAVQNDSTRVRNALTQWLELKREGS